LATSDIAQATKNRSEQFSCTDVDDIPQIECEALAALYENNYRPTCCR